MIEGRTDAAAAVRHLREYFAGTQGLVFLTLGMGLEKRIWSVTYRAEGIPQGQGEEAGRLLGNGAGQAVAKPGQEDTVTIG